MFSTSWVVFISTGEELYDLYHSQSPGGALHVLATLRKVSHSHIINNNSLFNFRKYFVDWNETWKHRLLTRWRWTAMTDPWLRANIRSWFVEFVFMTWSSLSWICSVLISTEKMLTLNRDRIMFYLLFGLKPNQTQRGWSLTRSEP